MAQSSTVSLFVTEVDELPFKNSEDAVQPPLISSDDPAAFVRCDNLPAMLELMTHVTPRIKRPKDYR